MNKVLASALSFLNGLLAFGLVMGGTIAGAYFYEGRPKGLILGYLAGSFAAVVVCGFLALIIEIRNELVLIRTSLSGGRD